MDLENTVKQAADALGIKLPSSNDSDKTKPTRKRRAKKKVAKATKKTARRVGRPAKTQKPAAKPKKLPKTKLLQVRFMGDAVNLTFRDMRKLRTPLKYLDKRLTKLAPKDLRKAEISKNGRTISWPEHNILVEVAYAMHCEH